jgi:formamidopyrimidine-DNA glycosylase
MPELPEVETVVRSLAKHVTGDVIESAWFSGKPQTFKSPPQEIASVIEGAHIVRVLRQGKHIVIDLERVKKSQKKSTSAQWIVHLGMTGSLLVTRPDADIEKHTHVIAKLAAGKEIRFVDPRRFGRTWVVTDANGFEAGGHEPLDVGFEIFAGLFRGRKTPIKSALLNQKLLRGVGNIYADESLFRAKVRPRRRAASLTRDELQRLYRAVQQVLTEAIAAGGSSISDYVDANGDRGMFQIQHRIYGREGEPCVVCRTPIKRVVVAGRSTHYCPKCQK